VNYALSFHGEGLAFRSTRVYHSNINSATQQGNEMSKSQLKRKAVQAGGTSESVIVDNGGTLATWRPAMAVEVPRWPTAEMQAEMDHKRDVQAMQRWTMLRAQGFSRNQLADEHAWKITLFGQPPHNPHSEWE